MKKFNKTLSLNPACLLLMALLTLAACDNGTVNKGSSKQTPNQAPVSADFNISGLVQAYDGMPKPVDIAPKEGKSAGTLTVFYNGNTAPPIEAGVYDITFNVAAVKGWNEALGLNGGKLTINRTEGSFVNISPIDVIYSPGLTLADINLPENYSWNNPAVLLDAGSGQTFPATYIHPSGNHEPAGGFVTVNVEKAEGSFGNVPPINVIYSPGLTLADINLPENYLWNNTSVSINAGNGQTFPATYIHPSGNYKPASGFVTVNVAKAAGAVVEEAAANIITINSITVNAVSAPGNGQSLEYAISTNTALPASGWQDGLIFSSLNVNTLYFIFARSKENSNYNAGTAAISSGILTYSGFSIIFVQPADETINLNTSINTPLSQAANDYIDILITQSFTSIRWYIDGVLNASLNNLQSIRIYAAALNTGSRSLSALVFNESAWYSKRMTFTVGK